MSQSNKPKKFRIKIDDALYEFEQDTVTGAEILQKSGNNPIECYALYQLLENRDFEKIDYSEKVDLSNPGVERFVVKPAEVINYFVDDEPETTDKKELTPNQILELAGITPCTDYYLVQIFEDGKQVSYMNEPDNPIEMICYPTMRFVSVFRGETPVS